MKEKAQWTYEQLVQTFGLPRWEAGEDPVATLLGTILSANTNDVNSERAFNQLTEKFDNNWDQIRCAPLTAIIEAIRPAGMYHQKAPAIVATLEIIKAERHAYNLDHLATVPVEQALAWLTKLPGVGRKTASILLLFCFNRAAFPVDTHIQRISQRLGICRRTATPNKIAIIWEALLPPHTFYALHINLIQHGRTICQARQAKCEICPLQQKCDYFQSDGDWRGSSETDRWKVEMS